MNKKRFILSIAMGIATVNGVLADGPNKDIDIFDINTVEYIEDEVEINLGFDTADYLPEGFDPYKVYVDLNAIEYVEEEEMTTSNLSKYLPKNFDAYANPTDVQSISYIADNDSVELNFETKKHLPKGFNAYIK